MTRVENSQASSYYTPEQVFEKCKKVVKPIDQLTYATYMGMDNIGKNACTLAGGVYPLAAKAAYPWLGLTGLVLLPFRIAQFGEAIAKALKAKDWKTFGRTILDALTDIPALAFSVLTPFNLAKALKVIGSVPVFPGLSEALWGFGALKGALDIYDLGKHGRIFHIIRTGKKNLETEESAVQELDRLKTLNSEDVTKQLDLAKKINLVEKIDTLRGRLLNKEPGALRDTKEFYAKMHGRVKTTFSLSVVNLAFTITSIVLGALLLFTPLAPAAIAIALGAVGISSIAFSLGKQLFLKSDIFDPNAKSPAQKAVSWVKDKAVKLHQGIQYVFNKSVPIRA